MLRCSCHAALGGGIRIGLDWDRGPRSPDPGRVSGTSASGLL